MRILIVDDHLDTAEAFRTFLDAHGHSTLAVGSGAEAIACISTFEPQVVILDIDLPDMSGYEVIRAIRERADSGQIHVIAATGSGTPQDRVRAAAAGFDQYQLKPFDAQTLAAVVAVASERLGTSSS